MKDKFSKDKRSESDDVIRRTRLALERLSAEAGRLRRLSELQSLKANPVELSVDTQELLDVTKSYQVKSRSFATLEEMMSLLWLMAAQSDHDEIAPVSSVGSRSGAT